VPKSLHFPNKRNKQNRKGEKQNGTSRIWARFQLMNQLQVCKVVDIDFIFQSHNDSSVATTTKKEKARVRHLISRKEIERKKKRKKKKKKKRKAGENVWAFTYPVEV
jgi:hypothetical protein